VPPPWYPAAVSPVSSHMGQYGTVLSGHDGCMLGGERGGRGRGYPQGGYTCLA